MPKVIPFTDATSFLEKAERFLSQNEAANELILGIALQQQAGISGSKTTTFYAVVDNDEPVLVAMYTPEVWPTMTDGPEDAAVVLAKYLHAAFPDATAVHGPPSSVNGFISEWKRLSGCEAEMKMHQRIYQCKRVNQPDLPHGSARRSVGADYELILRWRDEFYREVGMTARSDNERTRLSVDQGRYFLWATDTPVSLAGYGRETPYGAMVGPVYTPPEQRGRGYATACVAAVTQAILDDGKRYASLYTDLDNPTSNSIYQKIGYEPVSDADMWTFMSVNK